MNQDISSSRENLAADLSQRFTEAIRASQAATDLFDETMAHFLGINRTDGRCLDIIDRHGKVSAGHLANESGLTTGAVTAVIDRLETAGYVQRVRDMSDRRKVWVEPTEAMKAITGRIFSIYRRTGPAMMQRFSEEQVKAIMEFLGISAYMNQEMASGLREHHDPAATSATARLIQARAFERAMEASADRFNAELDALGDAHCAPGK